MKRILLRLCLLTAAIVLVKSCTGCSAAAVPVSAAGARRTLPILMYHSILRDDARAGDYTVSPETFEADLRYLQDAGYETVVVADLIAFVAGMGELPARPVMLTFDDGYYNNLTYVLPLLEQYDMRAVLSVVGAFADRYTESPDPNPSYGCLSWPELQALSEGGRFELQCHSYDLHALGRRRGSGRLPGETDTAYRSVFFSDTERALERMAAYGLTPAAYTYPFGCIGAGSEAYLREMGFSASLSCFERTNVLTVGDPDCLFCLGRFNRPASLSTAAYMKKALGEPAAETP